MSIQHRRKVSKRMELLNERQMVADLQNFLSKDSDFLDNPEIPTDPYILNLIGFGLRKRYREENNIEDIERAALLLEIAVETTTVTSLDWMNSVNNLSKTYYLYYASTSNAQHLQRTIHLSEQLIEHAPSNSPYLEYFLHQLASYLLARGRRTKSISDIRRASRAWNECITYTTQTSQHRYVYMSRLFSCLLAYDDLQSDTMHPGDTMDLLKLSLDSKTIETSKYSIIAGLLGDCMMRYYFQNRQLSDLDMLIDCWEQSLHRTSSNTTCLSDLNRLLFTSFVTRFLDLKYTNELQQAVTRHQAALYVCKPGTPQYAQNLYDLGQILRLLYKQTNDLADLNYCIEIFEQAMATQSSSSPMRPTYRATLAEALQKRYKRTADIADLKRINQLRWLQ